MGGVFLQTVFYATRERWSDCRVGKRNAIRGVNVKRLRFRGVELPAVG